MLLYRKGGIGLNSINLVEEIAKMIITVIISIVILGVLFIFGLDIVWGIFLLLLIHLFVILRISWFFARFFQAKNTRFGE